MIKRILITGFIGVTMIVLFFLFSGATSFSEKSKTFFIKSGSDFTEVNTRLNKYGFVKYPRVFKMVARITGYTDSIKSGKYNFNSGASIWTIITTLKAGKQMSVELTIGKLRLKQELIALIADNFECKKLALQNYLSDTLKQREWGVNEETLMTLIIPGTYEFYWNANPSEIIEGIVKAGNEFWTSDRKEKASELNLSPIEVYILASIVEEETNMKEDKGKIASVYINRMKIGMKLGADPTVKFAMKDFSLKRIYLKHLKINSPYNTYQVTGLPPGPICTPSANTLEEVLNAPNTDYLYFVAKSDFKGYSNFAATYEEHLKYAKEYQDALNKANNNRIK
jgi:UPF0755 protein